MQFMVIFTNSAEFAGQGLPADFDARMAEDAARLRALYGEGVLRQVWTLDTRDRGGAALFEVGSADELHDLMPTIPLVRVGYNDYEVLPLGPYPGFAPKT